VNKRKNQITILPKRRYDYIYLFLLVLIPLLLNWKNINYEFTSFDDSIIITNNYSFLSDLSNVLKSFETDTFFRKSGETYYRPLQNISFMIDAQISGEKPSAYHFSNILYHILTVIVLFFLLRKLGVRDNISFLLSLLFAVHPLFTVAIAWIPGRGDLLAGLFGSLSFLSFIYYTSKRNNWFFILHSAVFLLALLSKEISVVLPVVLIFYYLVVQKNKYDIRGLLPFIILWGLSVSGFFLLRHIYLNPQSILSFHAFISNLQMIPVLLGKLFVPLGLSAMPVYDLTFTILGTIILITSLIYIRKLKILDKSIIIFGLVWFIGFIVPAMFVVLPLTNVHYEYLEHRAYLPSIGIFIALGILLNEILKEDKKNILIIIILPLIVIFSFISYNYSEDFADGITFFSSLIKTNPENSFAYGERGRIYLSKNNPDLALSDFDNSIRISPTNSLAYFHKGVLYNSLNNPAYAEQLFSTALNYDTLYPLNNSLHANIYFNLSSVKLNLKKYEDVIILLNKGIFKYPDNAGLHNNLGLAYYNISKFDAALFEYNKAINAEQNIPSYYNSRGLVELHLNDYKNAIIDFNSALNLKPDYLQAWGNMGRAKINVNDYEGAINDLTKAISIKKDLATLWYFRGLAYSKLNKQVEAEKDWIEARKLGFKE
jgi:tetratricopeptide (TPR) repeat protein